jgi:hypothetical protein
MVDLIGSTGWQRRGTQLPWSGPVTVSICFEKAIVQIVAAFAGDVPEVAATDADVTYGLVRELVAGQKVVIDIEHPGQKPFDLSDRCCRQAR